MFNKINEPVAKNRSANHQNSLIEARPEVFAYLRKQIIIASAGLIIPDP